MAVELVMPRLSDSMSEGTIVSWLVADGVAVERGQEIAEIETDKSTVPYEAPEAGVLRILVAPGTTLPLGEPIALIDDLAPLAEEAEWSGTHTVRASVPPPAPAPAAEPLGLFDDEDEQETTEFGAIDPDLDIDLGLDDPWGEPEPATQPPAAAPAPAVAPPAPPAPAAPVGLPWIDPASSAHRPPAPTPEAAPLPVAAAPPEPTAPAADETGRFTPDELIAPPRPLPPQPPELRATPSEHAARVPASPVARRLAGELGLDLAAIRGTGPDGRVVRADIDAAVAAGHARPVPEPASPLPSERAVQPAEPAPVPEPEAEAEAPSEPEAPEPHAEVKDDSQPGTEAEDAMDTAEQEPAEAPEPAAAEVPSYSLAPPGAAQTEAAEQEGKRVMPSAQAGGGKGTPEPIELSRQQATVARRMAEGRATIPEFQLTLTVDAGPLSALRDELRQTRPDLRPPTVNDLVVKATALALRAFPRLNAAYRDGRVEEYPKINVGIAVDAGEQLIVPVVHGADELGINQLAERTSDLVQRATSNSLRPPDVASATFTISNLGALGIEQFTAIITPGQAGMLTVGEVRHEPVVRNGAVVAGQTLRLTLLADHRVVYGAEAARFLTRIRELLQRPAGLLT